MCATSNKNGNPSYPISTKPNPMSISPLIATPSLSNPAANPIQDGKINPDGPLVWSETVFVISYLFGLCVGANPLLVKKIAVLCASNNSLFVLL